MVKFNPLFIFGVARSGTNLLARSISNHPHAMVALDPFMPLFKTWRNLAIEPVAKAQHHQFDPQCPFQDFYFDPSGSVFLNTILNVSSNLPLTPSLKLKASIYERAALENPGLADTLRDLDGNTIEEIFISALNIIAGYAQLDGKSHPTWIGLKEVWAVEFVKSLAQAFPKAKFLVIHRDPRAVVASLIALINQDSSQAAHTVSYMRHWRKQVSVTHQLATDPTVSPRLLSILYEDLVTDPVTWLTKIGQFLNLEDPACLLTGLRSGKWQGNSSFGTSMGINADAAERWRHHLTLSLRATVEFHCAPEMAMLGYARTTTGHMPLQDIRDCISEADRNPGKWRSDSGDVEADFIWELRRWQLLRGQSSDIQEVRRCFLFESVYEKLLQINTGALYTDCELMP
ncbi:sulfotransferase [bacterium]|nr:sulfotransferase [bacterium]